MAQSGNGTLRSVLGEVDSQNAVRIRDDPLCFALWQY